MLVNTAGGVMNLAGFNKAIFGSASAPKMAENKFGQSGQVVKLLLDFEELMYGRLPLG
jgi:hypothetical protein